MMSTTPALKMQAPVLPAALKSPAVHSRVNDTFLSRAEKKTLRWLAERLPGWVTPDQMTALGFVAGVLIFAGYALTNVHPAFLWLVNFAFALNWFGDSLDGTLARYRKIERPKYGYFLDHSVDSVIMLLVALGLGASPYVRLDFALLAIGGYFMMSILTYLTTYVRGVFQLSYASFGPTEMRIFIVLVNSAVYFLGNPSVRLYGLSLSFFDGIALFAAIALISTFLVSAARQASELAVLDNPKTRAPGAQ